MLSGAGGQEVGSNGRMQEKANAKKIKMPK